LVIDVWHLVSPQRATRPYGGANLHFDVSQIRHDS
jgi:hypothetical protein